MTTALPHASGPVRGTVTVPGSKSATNRALVLAALSSGPSTISGALDSRDSSLMIAALRQFGVTIDEVAPGTLRVTPGQLTGGHTVDCGLAGTVMRFLPPITLLSDAPVTFDGDPHARERPMRGLLDALRALGAEVSNDSIPVTVSPNGGVGGDVEVDSSASSQFVSGLLIVGALLEGGLTVRHTGDSLPSLPHIEMTMAMLREHGVDVQALDERTWHVEPGELTPVDRTIEPDLTNAAVFFGAAAVAEGEVSVPGWPSVSVQPGVIFLDVAQQLGCEVNVHDGVATVRGDGRLRGIDVDLHAASELTPVVTALAAVADGETRIRGVAHIRGHETDRISALAAELQRAGIPVTEHDDGLTITGGRPQAAAFESYADHRMVHFAALLGLSAEGSTISDMGAVSKTMPTFETIWSELA